MVLVRECSIPCCSSFIVAELAAKTTPMHAAKMVAASALWAAAAAKHSRPEAVVHDRQASSAVGVCQGVACIFVQHASYVDTFRDQQQESPAMLGILLMVCCGSKLEARQQTPQGRSTYRGYAGPGGGADLVHAVDQDAL